ncbi:MAG: Kef-type transport system, predicted NAD-binding component [Deferribacteraceae bacterium]|jgi:voltage-gated potassium channel|nr:Kef-type transport system, predicted NAD-binding component [Deferribacteraceae bacterium]
MTLRKKLYEIIFEAETKAGKLFDVVLLISICISILVVILQSVESIHVRFGSIFYAMEWFFTILFTIEYGLRIYTIEKPIRYIRSFYGIVDLLAILPTYLELFFSRYTLFIGCKGIKTSESIQNS